MPLMVPLFLPLPRVPMRPSTFILLLLVAVPAAAQDGPTPDTTWQVFEPGVISLSDTQETSPSITADGQTMVFARTENWNDKVSYIATRNGEGWRVRKAPFADTLYNLAVSPDGQSIFFKTNETQDGEDVSRAYRVDRTEDEWNAPQDLPALYNINAGYFCPMADGTLYFFAPSPRPGIYRTEPDGDGGYESPQWVSDVVSPEGTTSFNVLVHPDEDRLIITRAGLSDDQESELGHGASSATDARTMAGRR